MIITITHDNMLDGPGDINLEVRRAQLRKRLTFYDIDCDVSFEFFFPH